MKKSIRGIVCTSKTWLQVYNIIYKIIVPVHAHFKCGGNANNIQEKMLLIITRNFSCVCFSF